MYCRHGTVVRTCVPEGIENLEDVRAIIKDEVSCYNNCQVHSTAEKIPALCFCKILSEGNSLFRPFYLPQLHTSLKDISCLREQRTVNGYRRISLFNH